MSDGVGVGSPSVERLSPRVVPDLVDPTMNTYGFILASAPATGLPDLAEVLPEGVANLLRVF
jgi:hypothetical protein